MFAGTLKMKKITKATLKSFLNKNKTYTKQTNDFDGSDDCLKNIDRKFELNTRSTGDVLKDVLVYSRNFFNSYNDGQFEGIEVSNCCGRHIIAKKI